MPGVSEPETRPPADEPAHDILAAEAFAVPAPDPVRGEAVSLPDDPAGIPEPHDILAAEEFAMPAPDAGAPARRRDPRLKPRRLRWVGIAATGAGLLVLRIRRRRD